MLMKEIRFDDAIDDPVDQIVVPIGDVYATSWVVASFRERQLMGILSRHRIGQWVPGSDENVIVRLSMGLVAGEDDLDDLFDLEDNDHVYGAGDNELNFNALRMFYIRSLTGERFIGRILTVHHLMDGNGIVQDVWIVTDITLPGNGSRRGKSIITTILYPEEY